MCLSKKGIPLLKRCLASRLWGWLAASWITHIVVCLKAGSWGFLIAGAIAFPVAVINGTGAWFGAW